MYAPIVVFAYNRPTHLQRVLRELAKCPEAIDSVLYVFIDGPKKVEMKPVQDEVKRIASEESLGKFKEVHIICSDKNNGLSKSVISGVSKVINKYGRVIVTEDDSLPSKAYLSFMNKGLDYYANNKRIWSIGGYTVPMKIPHNYAHDVVMTQRVSSYAWATWKDRFECIDWNMTDYQRFRWNLAARKGFNRWGEDRSSMLDDQMNGCVNSWAIRFDYAMYKHDMYNIVPTKSLIKNIGHDGSGTHNKNIVVNDPFEVSLEDAKFDFILENIEIDETLRRQFCIPFTSSKIGLLKRYLKNQWLYTMRRKQHGN